MTDKVLPLGITDFKIVKTQCYYVDKTDFISEISRYPRQSVILITRPRRFGKSLALSTLDYFYNQDYQSQELFQGTSVSHNTKIYPQDLNSLPVIHFSMKNCVGKDYKEMLMNVEAVMSEQINLYPQLQSTSQDGFLNRLAEKKLTERELPSALLRLTEACYQTYQKPVLLLIDEYDAPLQSAFDHSYLDEAIDFFGKFLSSALKENRFLGKAVLTGISEISKASVFSGLNNLITNSVFSGAKEEYFGFRENETAKLLSDYGLSDSLPEVKTWYDGYLFQGKEVFNPWSVLSFIQNNGIFDTYWVNTGNNSLLHQLIEEGLSHGFADQIQSLLQGNTMETMLIYSAINYRNLHQKDVLYSLLVHAGYLVAQRSLLHGYFRLSIPNYEVALTFQQEVLRDSLKESLQLDRAEALRLAFRRGDKERIKESLEDYLSSFSYHDFTEEKNYQIFVLTLTAVFFDHAYLKSEVNAGQGRCDILLKTETGLGMVIELKYLKGRPSTEAMKESALRALNQIKRKEYAKELVNLHANRIVLYGMAFQKQRVEISEEEMDLKK